ncbi:MAG TPA: LON peptidase substrate-binding domain-containing protein, partial [Ignavibacteriaceae bacterium]
IVVFPFSKYPLHIFEERYKKLISRCLSEKSGFGIVAKLKEDISSIGVYVEIAEVTKKYPEGESDIVVIGKKRFYRKSLAMHKDGYYISDIDEFEDTDSEINYSLFEELLEKLKGLFDKFSLHLDDNYWQNLEKSKLKAFKVAEKSGLTIEQQQELLAMQTENNRLTFLIDHIVQLDKKLDEEVVMKDIIIGDGYLN